MIRKLTILGPAILAALAVAASAASAEEFGFASNAGHTDLVGEQIEAHSFTVDAGHTTCQSVEYGGTMASEVEFEVALAPTYDQCIAFGFAEAEVNVNSCAFELTTATKEGSTYDVETAIDCAEANDSIAITVKALGVTKCVVHVHEQGGLAGVTVAETEASPTELHASVAIGGISYDQTAGSGLAACPTALGTTNGSYEGTAAIEGYGEGGQVDLELFFLGSMKMTPDPVQFSGVGDKEDVTVTNVGTRELDELTWSVPFGFVKSDKCKGTSLEPEGKPKDVCVEVVECQKKGSTGEVHAGAKPGAAASAKLTGCT